jgi:hypothetical protein
MQMRMKSICFSIWIPGALLFLFTFINLPHPLANVPSICQPHTVCLYSVAADDPVIPVTGFFRAHTHRAATNVSHPYSYLCPAIALDLAANLSPPRFDTLA